MRRWNESVTLRYVVDYLSYCHVRVVRLLLPLLKEVLSLAIPRLHLHHDGLLVHARLHHDGLHHAGLHHARLVHARLHHGLHHTRAGVVVGRIECLRIAVLVTLTVAAAGVFQVRQLDEKDIKH